jgi:hypothetical protein
VIVKPCLSDRLMAGEVFNFCQAWHVGTCDSLDSVSDYMYRLSMRGYDSQTHLQRSASTTW